MSRPAVEARLGILDTMGRYVHLVDRGRLEEMLELFTQDGILAPHGLPECSGRQAIARFLMSSRASRGTGPAVGPIRHHVSSVEIEFQDEAHATARSYFLAMNRTGPDHWGVYRDRFLDVDGAWLFAMRSVAIEGATPDGWIGSGTGPVTFAPERNAAGG